MKTTLAIAAIAMFAVILGMSALAPAMAAKPDQADKIWVCHFADTEVVIDPETGLPVIDPETGLEVTIPAHYDVIHISENGWNGHQNHNDGNADQDYRDIENDEDVVRTVCVDRNAALETTDPTTDQTG